MTKLLIVGDPRGVHSKIALRKYEPEDIWVWENDSSHIYTINQISGKINVTTDLQELIDKGMKFDVKDIYSSIKFGILRALFFT